MAPTVFIDGEAGTTGLQIRERLEHRADLTLVSIEADKRKDSDERRRLLNSADAVILCLPDEAAKEAVAMIKNDRVKVIDASTAHRVAPDWAYGFAEMSRAQRAAIAASKRVANPGCYPTGFIRLVRPLVEAGAVERPEGLEHHCALGRLERGLQALQSPSDEVDAAVAAQMREAAAVAVGGHRPSLRLGFLWW